MNWQIEYYQDQDGSVPAALFLDGCPAKIDAQFNAVLDAVAAAPRKHVRALGEEHLANVPRRLAR